MNLSGGIVMGTWFYMLILFIRAAVGGLSNGFIKQYQKTAPKGNAAYCLYCLIMSVCAMAYFFISGGFKIAVNLPTVLYSIAAGVDTVVVVILSVVAMKYIDLLTLSFSQSCGSMIIPVLFGILFLNEQTSLLFWISAFLMAAAVLLPIIVKGRPKEHGTVVGYICCVILFFANGMYLVLLKLFQNSPIVTDENAYCFLMNLVMFAVTAAGFVFLAKKTSSIKAEIVKFTPKHVGYVVISAVASNSSTLLSFVVMQGMSIALMTILGTSLGILITAFMSAVVFKERKMKLVDILSILCAIASVVIGAL